MMENQHPTKNFYDLDYQVSPKAKPFFIKAKENNNTLIILVHGFSSSPYGLHKLADNLANLGWDVEAILLSGHGGSFEALRDSNNLEWYRSLEQVYLKYANIYENIFVIGDSFGANMCMQLAHHYPNIKGIVAINPAIFINKERYIRLALPLARIFMKRYKKNWHQVADLKNVREAGRHVYLPIKSIVQFYHFIDKFTKKTVNQITVPILIIHSRQDSVSSPRSSQWIYDHWATCDRQLFILQKSKHGFGMINSSRHDFIMNKIDNFISRRCV